MAKAHANSWEVTDEFWSRVEPLIPLPVRDLGKHYKRAAGAGRPGKPPRRVFEAIMYVLRTGCQWKTLPCERFGSASAIHQKFMLWSKAGSSRTYGAPVLPSMTSAKISPGADKASTGPYIYKIIIARVNIFYTGECFQQVLFGQWHGSCAV